MSTLKTHNLQSPDAASANIALAPNSGMVVSGISTFNGNIINSTGKIGIGTNNPDNLLHVHHATTNGLALFESSDAYCHITFQDSNSNTTVKPHFGVQADDFRFVSHDGSSATEKLRIKSNGKIGIGTDNPSNPLHITGANPQIKIQDSANGNNAQIFLDGPNSNLNFDWVSGADRKINFINSGSGDISVGINTNTPTEQLEIYESGNGAAANLRMRSLNGSTHITLDARGTNHGNYIYFTDSSATYNSFIHRSHSSNANFAGLRYCYNSSASEAFRISESGGFDMGGAGYGTTGQVLKSNGNAPPTWSGGSQRVLEVVASPCDGSTIATSNGNVTFQNVTAQQNLSTTYADVNGSVITYQPPAGTTQVIYEMSMQVTNHDDAVSIGHFRFYVDGTEVAYHRRNASSEDIDNFVNFKYIINIGGSANTNTGRIASWSNAKQMKMTAREYHATNNAISIHTTDHWNGSGTNQFSQPLLQITAIGV